MKRTAKQFALCVENSGYEVSLILGKVYSMLTDARAARDDLVRVIDESGEDYLFDKARFAFVEFPPFARRKLLAIRRREQSAVGHRYELLIYWSQEDDAFVVEVPELPGCMADGASPSLAVENAQEAIALWLHTAREMGRVIPEPKGR